jgi:hypothetical protein
MINVSTATSKNYSYSGAVLDILYFPELWNAEQRRKRMQVENNRQELRREQAYGFN